MDGPWATAGLLVVLVLINALFAGTEIALLSLREGQLSRLKVRARAGDDKTASALVELVEDPTVFLATIQLGITLSGFLASATAAVALAEPLVPALAGLGRAAEPVAIAAVTLVLTFVTLVAGELAPKRLAMQHALGWSLVAARPLRRLSLASRPAVWALGAATGLLVRLFGGFRGDRDEPASAEELRELVVEHRGLRPEQRRIITGVLDAQERSLRDILVPRGSVFTLKAEDQVPAARRALLRSGHRRAPVTTSKHLDDVLGLVELGDLLADSGTVGSVAHPPVLLPETVGVTEALHWLRGQGCELAIVVSEHGTLEGIVTVQDIVDEIVGDLERPHLPSLPSEGIVLPGRFAVHRLPELGIDLEHAPAGDYVTVAGLVLLLLGKVPDRPGDRVRFGDWFIDVASVADHAISAVRIRPARRGGAVGPQESDRSVTGTNPTPPSEPLPGGQHAR